MEATWHRVSETILGDSHEPGTLSIFFDYNLASWTFGVRFETDPCWFSFYLDLGPISFSPTYWRRVPTDTGSVT